MQLEQGPYVQIAAFCEQVIEEKSGVISLIRLIDGITRRESGSNPAEEMPTINYRMKLVIILKPGRARGRQEIRVIPELPSGETGKPFSFSLYMEGESRAQNLVSDFRFTFALEGIYWFNVYVGEAILTRIPFHVRYLPVHVTQLSEPAA